MNQLAGNLGSSAERADRQLPVQPQRARQPSAQAHHGAPQHHFVQAQAQAQFQQHFSKHHPQQRAGAAQGRKSERESPVSPLQLSSDASITSPAQRQSPMLTVPSLDLGGLYRQNLGGSHSFSFQQQNQIPTLAGAAASTSASTASTAASTSTAAATATGTPGSSAKEPFQSAYDGQAAMEGSSADLSNDAEDSSNMIAGIITKICFDLSSENQQQLQIAHSVGLRVYEALSGKMNQYRLELQNLRRVIEEKDRRIQLLESLQQQTRQTTQMQMAKFAASPTPSGYVKIVWCIC